LPISERHRGPVIDPEDSGYDPARTTFNGMIDRRPATIVRPLDVDDVAAAVSFAREADLPVAVRRGGHSVAGHCIGD
jgi:FAD/FMN-containing dehydrogenase